MSTEHIKSAANSVKDHLHEAKDDILTEGKKLADELYIEGRKKVEFAKKEAQEYTDDLLDQVREHPLKAVLIAGGIGFLLSVLLKK